jgi:hypothetical protein
MLLTSTIIAHNCNKLLVPSTHLMFPVKHSHTKKKLCLHLNLKISQRPVVHLLHPLSPTPQQVKKEKKLPSQRANYQTTFFPMRKKNIIPYLTTHQKHHHHKHHKHLQHQPQTPKLAPIAQKQNKTQRKNPSNPALHANQSFTVPEIAQKHTTKCTRRSVQNWLKSTPRLLISGLP